MKALVTLFIMALVLVGCSKEEPAPASPPVETDPAEAQAAAPAPDKDYIEELEKLGDLRERGIITDEDFEAKKRQLLGI